VSSWDPGRNGSAAVPTREGSGVLSSVFVNVRHSGRVSMILSARTRPGCMLVLFKNREEGGTYRNRSRGYLLRRILL
jgi:hypothetical protein